MLFMIQHTKHTNTQTHKFHDSDIVQVVLVHTRASTLLVYNGSVALRLIMLVVQKQPTQVFMVLYCFFSSFIA